MGDELIEIVQNGQNRKAMAAALASGGWDGKIVVPSFQIGYLTAGGTSASSTSYAMKGNLFKATRDLTLLAWVVRMNFSSTSERYKFMLYKVADGPYTIEEVVYESGTFVPVATSSTDISLWFDEPIELEQGKHYAAVIVRTDGSATAACRCIFPNAAPSVPIPGLEFVASIRQAALVLGVGGEIAPYVNNNHTSMDFIFSYDIRLTSLNGPRALPIINGDFEEEALDGWTVTKGTPSNEEPDNSAYADIEAYSGSEFLKHGNEDGQDFEVEQELEMALAQGGLLCINAHAATANLADRAYCEAEFLDPTDTVLDVQRSPLLTPAVDLWFPQQCLFRVPQRTVKVKLRLGGENGGGDVTAVAIDKVAGWYAPMVAAIPKSQHRGAMAVLHANKSVGSAPINPVPWDVAEYDTDGFWDIAHQGRFTIPKGVSKVKLYATFSVASAPWSATDNWSMTFLKNGSTQFRGASQIGGTAGFNDTSFSIASPPIPVVEGDYFEVRFHTSNAASLTMNANMSHFTLEVVE